jgi:hypothetical protein
LLRAELESCHLRWRKLHNRLDSRVLLPIASWIINEQAINVHAGCCIDQYLFCNPLLDIPIPEVPKQLSVAKCVVAEARRIVRTVAPPRPTQRLAAAKSAPCDIRGEKQGVNSMGGHCAGIAPQIMQGRRQALTYRPPCCRFA